MAEMIADLINWQVITAYPGFFLWGVEENELVNKEPIIGWLIEQRRKSLREEFFWWGKPLVATVHDIDDFRYAIELPDGKIFFPEERMCDSLEEAQKYLREQKAHESS